MKLKCVPEDFIVDELYDLDEISKRDEERRDYFYFFLTKKNYAQMRAIEKVAKILNTSRKLINFAGTKDKVGITTGLISVYNLNEDNLQKNLDFLNNEVDDLNLVFLGKFRGRISLGDNLGNKFKIMVRDLTDDDLNRAKSNLKSIVNNGILNLFDEQRFGYANNSHIVGKYILQNNIGLALKEVLTSCPKNSPSENIVVYTNYIKENWDLIVSQNVNVLDHLKEIVPKFLLNDIKVINHLYKFKNDFPGAFRLIPKKIRTLYVNAYQSYLFNEVLLNIKNIPEKLELYNASTNYEIEEIKVFVNSLLEKDNLTQENFNLKSMPELNLSQFLRDTKGYISNLKLGEALEDDLFENKSCVLVEFELKSGEYATNVIKQLFI